jgi:hypothetical protein
LFSYGILSFINSIWSVICTSSLFCVCCIPSVRRQPAVGSQFFPIYHQLSPPSHSQHLKISFHFFSPSFPESSSSSRPYQFLSEDLFVVILSSSILSRWSSHLILCMPCQLKHIPLRYFNMSNEKHTLWGYSLWNFSFDCILFQVKSLVAVFAEHVYRMWLGIEWVF